MVVIDKKIKITIIEFLFVILTFASYQKNMMSLNKDYKQ